MRSHPPSLVGIGEHDKTHRIILKLLINHQRQPLVGYCVTLTEPATT